MYVGGSRWITLYKCLSRKILKFATTSYSLPQVSPMCRIDSPVRTHAEDLSNILRRTNWILYLANCLPQFRIGLIHFTSTTHFDAQILKSLFWALRMSRRCFTSRISAKRVVVKWTVPSSSIGWFILINFLNAKRSGHLLPNPKGGSMFLSMSYISE